jgi:LysR family transcriptional activator of nhaA
MLLPGSGTQLRRTLETWFEDENIAPRIAGEVDDAALIKVFAEAGAGVVAAPSVIADQIEKQYDLLPIGRTEAVREFYYAISAERRLKHPAVLAISDAARERLFVSP